MNSIFIGSSIVEIIVYIAIISTFNYFELRDITLLFSTLCPHLMHGQNQMVR